MMYAENNRMRCSTIAVLVLMTVSLGACATDPVVTSSIPQTFRERHALVVAEGSEVLDIVPGGGPGGLTDRQREDIRGFARIWRDQGRGLVAIQLPQGGATDLAATHTLRAVRNELALGGVPSRAITTSHYPATHPSQLAPLRIAFPRLSAEVASQCGQWPEDLANGLGRINRNNDTYTNFGCAVQSNMAAMIADPEDLIRPRAETPGSGRRRVTTMDKYYTGQDTAASPGRTQAAETTE